MICMFLLHLKRHYDTHVDYILAFFYGNITYNISIPYAKQNLGGNGAEGNVEYVIEGTMKKF